VACSGTALALTSALCKNKKDAARENNMNASGVSRITKELVLCSVIIV
jgi:hypothetical protein